MTEPTPIRPSSPSPEPRSPEVSPNGHGPRGLQPLESVVYDPNLRSGVEMVRETETGKVFLVFCFEGANGSFRFPVDLSHAKGHAASVLKLVAQAEAASITIAGPDALRRLPPTPPSP